MRDDNDLFAYIRAELTRRFPRDSDLWRALEVQWRIEFGGRRHYIAKKSQADRVESPPRDATEGSAT